MRAAAEVGGKAEEAAPAADEAAQSQVLIGHLASYQVRRWGTCCAILGDMLSWGTCCPMQSSRGTVRSLAWQLRSACVHASEGLFAAGCPQLQGMGRASVECISGCACEPSVLDGWWERHASLQVMHTIRVSAGGHRGVGGDVQLCAVGWNRTTAGTQPRHSAPRFVAARKLPAHARSRLAPANLCNQPQVSEHPECRIKLTVLNESTGKGKAAGHKVRLGWATRNAARVVGAPAQSAACACIWEAWPAVSSLMASLALHDRLQVKLMAALVLAGTSTEGLSKPGKLAAISR